MQPNSQVYACGSNLYQQIQEHDKDGQPLYVTSPIRLTLDGLTVTNVLAVSASQVFFESLKDGLLTASPMGFASDNGLGEEASLRHGEVNAWLGKDMLKAYMTSDGQLHTSEPKQRVTKWSCAAMDGQGHILAVSTGTLRLYDSLNDLHHDIYREVVIPGPLSDLSRASIYAGAAHFIILAKTDAGYPTVLGVGDNRFFQQGHSEASSWDTATPVEFFDEGVSPVVTVACGNMHTAFVTDDGALYMSGSDAKGQCGGFSEQEPCLVTFQVEEDAESEVDVLDIACGANHTVALTGRGIYVAGSSTCYVYIPPKPMS